MPRSGCYSPDMDTHDAPGTASPWTALRLTTGLTQREVERRLGWKSGHLSLIERGLRGDPEKIAALRAFYVGLIP